MEQRSGHVKSDPETWRRHVSTPLAVAVLAVSCALILLVRVYVFHPVYILEHSMEPTLHSGDRCFSVNIRMYPRGVDRGDIVSLRDPRGQGFELTKRIIGLPGEIFSVADGQVFINGQPLHEPYTSEALRIIVPPLRIPEGHVMALGDNRNHSEDSLVWGPVPMALIRSKVAFQFWPLAQVRSLAPESTASRNPGARVQTPSRLSINR